MFIGGVKRSAADDVWDEYIDEQYRDYYREFYEEVLDEMAYAQECGLARPSDIYSWSHSNNPGEFIGEFIVDEREENY